MALPIASLTGTPYEIAAGPPPLAVRHAAPPVFAYDWNAFRVTVTTNPTTMGRTHVTSAQNAAGDTIFLPFQQNQVHSVYIQTGLAYAAGVRGFITVNLSGCRLYIDRVTGSNDLIIYHANALAIGPYIKPGQVAPLNPPDPLDMDKETVARAQALDAQHTNARAYWISAAPGPALNNPTTIAALGATTYYTSVAVIGALVPGGWQISWQTYGDTTYTGPGAGKALAAANMTVLATGQLRTQ